VRIGGGPATVRDFLAADLIDVLHVVQVPILLGRPPFAPQLSSLAPSGLGPSGLGPSGVANSAR
jgi:dihydrofolate reductase